MADNETIADIIAEMRGMGNYQRYSGDHARVLANRLDAAHRRERGDCAKLREALEMLRELLGDLLRLGDAEYHDDFSNFCDIIDAALSAPPRNCDRFATVDEARKAHEEYRGDYIMRASNKFDFPMKFEAWLLATATEKEGGDK